jgi:hypothetical protein
MLGTSQRGFVFSVGWQSPAEQISVFISFWFRMLFYSGPILSQEWIQHVISIKTWSYRYVIIMSAFYAIAHQIERTWHFLRPNTLQSVQIERKLDLHQNLWPVLQMIWNRLFISSCFSQLRSDSGLLALNLVECFPCFPVMTLTYYEMRVFGSLCP